MPVPRALRGLLVALPVTLGVLASGCAQPWLRVHQVPEDGFERTLNYQFQAQVHADSLGKCHMMVVRVKALNKFYGAGEPPPRLQLFDDDCLSPVRFERAQYVSRETGEQVRLSGPAVNQFLGSFARLENELIGWLWRAGVI